jgi:hypothetical protein
MEPISLKGLESMDKIKILKSLEKPIKKLEEKV